MDNILVQVFERWNSTKFTIDSYIDKLHPIMLLRVESIKQGVVELLNRGVKGRTITEVTEENIPYLKKLIEIAGDADAFRHLDNVTGNFSISDKKIYQAQIMGDLSAPSSYLESTNETSNDFSTDPKSQKKQHQALTSSLLPLNEQLKFKDNTKTATEPQSIMSTIKPFVDQQQYIFDMMWDKAIPVDQVIKQIEEGIKPAFIETFRDPLQIHRVALELIQSAKEEVLAIFSTTDAFILQKQMGIINLLDLASKRGIPIRLITPNVKTNDHINGNPAIDNLHNKKDGMDIDTTNKKEFPNIIQKNGHHFTKSGAKVKTLKQKEKFMNIRFIEYDLQTKVSILIVDKKLCLTVELKDNVNIDDSLTSVGLSTYSNSKPTVSSYVTIFEALWRQVDLIEEIKESKRKLESANKQLKASDKKMKDFVNIAAHELRTPLQPIVSYNVLAKKGMIGKDEALDVIDKYSKRLQNLSADLLVIGKIESGSLSYKFEKLRIKELVLDVVESVIRSHPELNEDSKKILVDFKSKDLDKCMINGDRQRITQLLTNILNNAIKFTAKGNIMIDGGIIFLSKNLNVHSNNKKYKHLQIKISDTGTGIPEDILPKIFEKFVTKSIKVGKDLKQGTGLGLFICKSIVKSHKGKIYAYNNDGNGATFVVELPVQK